MAFYVSLDLMDQKGLIIWFGLGFNFQQYFSYIVVLLVEENGVPKEITVLLQVTDKHYHILLYLT
jgi:hypothetical protein